MKRTLIGLIIVIVFVAVFPGCGASANDITGLWYDKGGLAGTLEFKNDGVVILVISDQTYNGTYTFNDKKGEGTINVIDPVASNSSFTLSNGEINVGGTAIYTRKNVNPKDIGKIIQDLGNSAGS